MYINFSAVIACYFIIFYHLMYFFLKINFMISFPDDYAFI